MKIIVSQLNARHRYIIPQLLYRNGMLYKLYTNSSLYSFLGLISKCFLKIGLKNRTLYRLSQRNPMIPKSEVMSSDLPLVKSFISKKLTVFEQNEVMYQSLSKKFIKEGIGSANCLYSMYFENIEFLRYAKTQKLKIVIDIYENPDAFKSLIDEINNHNEYTIFSNLLNEFKGKALFREKYINEILKLADYYTLPSEFVKKSLYNYSNFDETKVNIIPYPSSIHLKKYNYRPIAHKLIWVGNDAVRKGLIYCAKAAKILKNEYPNLQFNIIGSIDDKLKNTNVFSDLTFLGVMGKDCLIEEFETAEAYVFPTLFEGFAGTVIEAASCGCPVITTVNSGMDPLEFPGVFIPERNVNAIVESVISIFENSNYRNELSKKAFTYSSSLSPEIYEQKLINFFKDIETN